MRTTQLTMRIGRHSLPVLFKKMSGLVFLLALSTVLIGSHNTASAYWPETNRLARPSSGFTGPRMVINGSKLPLKPCGFNGCPKSRYIAGTQNDEDENTINNERIDEIKRHILRKLRMKAPPNSTIPRSMLPAPLFDGEIGVKDGKMSSQITKDIEDYYGRTEQVIIFAENEALRCDYNTVVPSSCIRFRLTEELTDRGVESAELWVFKNRNKRDALENQTFVLSETIMDSYRNHVIRKDMIAVRETNVKTGWLQFDLQHSLRRWKTNVGNGATHALYTVEVSCKTCTSNDLSDDFPISYAGGERPFIVIKMADGDDGKKRQRRNINCTPETTTCCRQSLYITFKDIGWDDWIIQPSGYQANYCKGSCMQGESIPSSKTHYTTLMQRLIARNTQGLTNADGYLDIPMPCCTPTKMSAISLLYVDDEQRLFQKNVPNMVVESCGCS